jgi:diadenosine tetraphosphate (Ap4A) HIT family hydrolase
MVHSARETSKAKPCEFCSSPGGAVVWQNELCRVVRADEPDYPGFVRVILNRHAREMSDLDPAEREAMMRVVFEVEAAVRESMGADKMNIASLGNQTPHVHWHVIPRFSDDRHFPTPIWSTPQRESKIPDERRDRALSVARAIIRRLG